MRVITPIILIQNDLILCLGIVYVGTWSVYNKVFSFRELYNKSSCPKDLVNIMVVKEVNESDFEKEVLKSEIPVVIDFWAPWCGPCRMFSPIIDEVSEDYKGKIKFVKINADDNQKLAEEYQVMGIPTVALIVKGKLKAVNVGAVGKDTIKGWINRNV